MNMFLTKIYNAHVKCKRFSYVRGNLEHNSDFTPLKFTQLITSICTVITRSSFFLIGTFKNIRGTNCNYLVQILLGNLFALLTIYDKQ